MEDNAIPRVISKIIKSDTIPRQELETIHKKIAKIAQYKTVPDERKLFLIDELLAAKGLKQPLDTARQNFIFERLGAYFEKYLNLSSTSRLLDIGGANGNLLAYLGTRYNIPKANLYCLEETQYKTGTTAFRYPYDNENVTYVFSDTLSPKQSNDMGRFDIIIAMVVLHHIPDPIIIQSIAPFIEAHITPAGYLLIKEHDAKTAQLMNLIDWEHHLYYLLETPDKIPQHALANYLATFVGNYKPMTYFVDLFRRHRFVLKKTFNNVFEPVIQPFRNYAATKLYWWVLRNSD